MYENCKCSKGFKGEDFITVKVDLGCDGEIFINVWGITFKELNKELHLFNKLYQEEKYCGSIQDYLNEKSIEWENLKLPVIDLSDYEDDLDDF